MIAVADCTADGVTVVYVNGILTTLVGAQKDLGNLRDEYKRLTSNGNVKFINGYNASHLEGLGDLIQSAAQTYGKTASYYDLNTILLEIHPQVTTQKVLLVGHSQGTFYTNELYEYLVANGVPRESIAVYNLATPASFVSGGGAYLTSANDKVINKIREVNATVGAPQPLPANILISLPSGEENDEWGGHHFSTSYLGMRPVRIVGDIESALRKLSAGGGAGATCFTPPKKNVSHRVAGFFYAVADPISYGVFTAGSAVWGGVKAVAGAIDERFAFYYNAPSGAQGGAAALASPRSAPQAPQTPTQSVGAVASAPGQQETTDDITDFVSPPDLRSPNVQNTMPSPTQTSPPVPVPQMPRYTPQPYQPGFGGGGGPSQSATSEKEEEQEPEDPEPPQPLLPASLAITSPEDNTTSSFASVTFSGTSTHEAVVIASYGTTTATTTANAAGEWMLALALPEGATTISFTAASSTTGTSETKTRTITIDTTGPDAPSLAVAECTYSLSANFCLVPQASATLSWGAASGAAYYALVKNGAVNATTTETSISTSLADQATTTLALIAYDAVGNASATSTEAAVVRYTGAVIINEVAWSGTAASSADEWLELYNPTSYTIVLDDVTLVSADGVPEIALSGAIASGAYYLIERTNDDTVSDITADLVVPFSGAGVGSGLSNDGEELRLVHRFGTAFAAIMDQTPVVATCSGWCGGSSEAFISMERVSGATDGALKASWQDNDPFTKINGTDAGGNPIFGTPRQENSPSPGAAPPVVN